MITANWHQQVTAKSISTETAHSGTDIQSIVELEHLQKVGEKFEVVV